MTTPVLLMHAEHPSNSGVGPEPPLPYHSVEAAAKIDHEVVQWWPEETDADRSRRPTKDMDPSEEQAQQVDREPSSSTGNSETRMRHRKGLDKKFECRHEGCGKSYSRAEHLYRHQLNRRYSLSYSRTRIERRFNESYAGLS
jgi:hypothetical protein